MTGHESTVLTLAIIGLSLLVAGLAGLHWHYSSRHRASAGSVVLRTRLWMVFVSVSVIGFTLASVSLFALSGVA